MVMLLATPPEHLPNADLAQALELPSNGQSDFVLLLQKYGLRTHNKSRLTLLCD